MDKWLEEFIKINEEMKTNKHETAKELIKNLQAVQSGKKSVGDAYHDLSVVLGLNEPLFPVYQKGTPVYWENGSNLPLYVMEDNGNYNALIATTMDTKSPDYNDWWVDKTFLKIIISTGE